MRPIVVIAGVLMLLAGATFSLQGANVLPGSFMTGSLTWLVIGIVLVALGLIISVFGVRAGRHPGPKITPPAQPPT